MTTYNYVSIYRERPGEGLDHLATVHRIAAMYQAPERGIVIEDERCGGVLLSVDRWRSLQGEQTNRGERALPSP